MNEVLQRAIARIKRGIEMAVKANDEKAVEELTVTLKALEKQISKEPIFESDGYADGCLIYDTWYYGIVLDVIQNLILMTNTNTALIADRDWRNEDG